MEKERSKPRILPFARILVFLVFSSLAFLQSCQNANQSDGSGYGALRIENRSGQVYHILIDGTYIGRDLQATTGTGITDMYEKAVLVGDHAIGGSNVNSGQAVAYSIYVPEQGITWVCGIYQGKRT